MIEDKILLIKLDLRLCLVAVKRFPENTYFPEMLISEKGKYLSVFGCISKKFSENIFWCLEKKKENTNPEKHKPQPRKKSSTTTTTARSRSEIAIDGAIAISPSSRDHDRRHDLAKPRSRSWIFLSRHRSRSRNGEIAINGAISPSDASPLAHARTLSLSLIFRKCFEGKIEV